MSALGTLGERLFEKSWSRDASRDELLEAIRAVSTGLRRVQPSVAVRLAERVNASSLTNR